MDRQATGSAALFSGREAFLREVHTTIKRTRTVVICAPAGMGKTTVALAYARLFAGEYEQVFYMNGASPEVWLADALDLLERLALPVQAGQDLAGATRTLRDWFAQHERYLLILDNASDKSLLAVAEQAGGHVLVLAREPLGASLTHMTLARPEERSGLLLLLRQSGQLAARAGLKEAEAEARAQAGELLEKLEGLPLAWLLAAAYLRSTKCGLGAYLQMYQEQREQYLDDNPVTPAAALLLQWAGADSGELARGSALLDVEVLPEVLLSLLQPEAGDALAESLATLERGQLLTRFGSAGTWSMHALVRAAIGETLQWDGRQRYAGPVLHALYLFTLELAKAGTEASRLRCVSSVLFLESWLEEWAIARFSGEQLQEAATLFSWGAALLRKWGLNAGALRLLRRAVSLQERLLGPTHADLLSDLRLLVELLEQSGVYEEAEKTYHKILKILAATQGGYHPDTLFTLCQLGMVYEKDAAKLEQAEECYREALTLCARQPGMDHPVAPVLQKRAGLFYLKQGRLEEAEALFQAAGETLARLVGEEHPDSIEAALLLYSAALAQEKWELCERVMLQVERFYVQTQGHQSVQTVQSKQMLALTYVRQGKWEEARPLLGAIAAWQERAEGKQAEAIDTLHTLSLVLLQLEELEEAEEALQQAAALAASQLGREHPATLTIAQSLAILYLKREQWELAEKQYRELLPLYERQRGPEHPETLACLEQLALLQARLQTREEAQVLARKILVAREKLAQAPDTLDSLPNLSGLAGIYLAQGRFNEAEQLAYRALAALESARSAQPYARASYLSALAFARAGQGDQAAADDLFQQALALWDATLTDHPELVNFQGLLPGTEA